MSDIKTFNIVLSHANVHLDLNNSKDIGNIQHVLTLLINVKGDKMKTIEILRQTSMKYLRRLQDDGIIADNSGPNAVPVINPFLTDLGVDFFKAGGYKQIFEDSQPISLEKSQVNITANNLQIGDNYGNYSQSLDARLKTQMTTNIHATGDDKQSTIIKVFSKYWWAFLIPVIIGIILLLIEYNFFH